jgi:RNA polymerase sigma-70 factor (ECF subfamily)
LFLIIKLSFISVEIGDVGMKTSAPLAAKEGNPRSAAEMSDEVLVSGIAKGDHNAMRLLFARHRGFVFKFALRMGSSDATAEDVVSDVFLEVWRRAAAGYGARSSVSTWLLGIARFKCLSERRSRKECAWDAARAENILDIADDPETALQHKESSRALQKGLARLSSKHGQVVDLLYYRDKSIKEVADIVGVSIPTVKTRVFYARKRLSEVVNAA